MTKIEFLQLISAFDRIKDFFLVFKTNVGAACTAAENLITLSILVWIGQFVVVVLVSDAFVNIKHLLKRVKGPVACVYDFSRETFISN